MSAELSAAQRREDETVLDPQWQNGQKQKKNSMLSSEISLNLNDFFYKKNAKNKRFFLLMSQKLDHTTLTYKYLFI